MPQQWISLHSWPYSETSTMIVYAILPPCLNNDSTLSLIAIMAILRTPTMTINALRHNDLTMTQQWVSMQLWPNSTNSTMTLNKILQQWFNNESLMNFMPFMAVLRKHPSTMIQQWVTNEFHAIHGCAQKTKQWVSMQSCHNDLRMA